MPSACATGGAVLTLSFMNKVMALLSPDFQQVLSDAFFYCSVREYIMEDIILGGYREEVAAKLGTALMFMSSTIMTMWVAFHGFQVMTGGSRQPIIPLFFKGGKIVLILSLVTFLAKESPMIVDSVSDFKELISQAVADGADITLLIDLNLGISALLSSITESMRAVDAGKDPNLVTTTVGLLGQSGPAMLTGVLLMLAELALTMAIMLSPLFIFFLLFQQTAQLFWSWAKFLLATLVSMSTLTLIASLALKATAVYGGSVVAAYYTNSGAGIGTLINGALGGPFDISGSSLRLAALGTLMSAIIVSIPATIMQFFNAGVGFAAGAMGFAGGGALAASLGQSKGLGAGTGIPGLSYGSSGAQATRAGAGSPSQDASASSSTGEMASLTNQAIHQRTKSIANNESESMLSYGARPVGEGRVGLVSENGGSHANAQMSYIKDKQSGAEFSRATGDGGVANAPSSSRGYANGTNVQDAVIKQHPHLGTGGALAVQGATAVAASRPAGVIASATGHSGSLTYGGSGLASSSVETPVYAAPRGQYAASRAATPAGGARNSVSYASSGVVRPRDGETKTG